MLAGHFGLAAVVKSRQPQVPLWSLMLATQLLDVVFVVLYLLGIEGFRTVPGTNGGYGNSVFTADYTHSLVGSLGISLLALLVALPFWGRRNALIIGVMVFSHWLLDLPVHRGDMPVLPGNAGGLPRLGLGLWTFPWLSAAMELVLIIAGAFLYYHASMRAAIRAERQEARQSGGSGTGASPAPATAGAGQRRGLARTTSLLLFAGLVLTLAGDFFNLLP